MSDRLKVVFIGQRDWCDLCADSVNGLSDDRIEAVGFEIDRPAHVVAPRKLAALARADVLVRVGFRPGSRTLAGRTFEAFWSVVRTLNSRAAVTFYWIGTDVSLALEHVHSGVDTTAMRKLADSASHMAVTDELCRELGTVGIHARTVGIPWTRAIFPAEPPDLPDKFTVFSYVPDTRAEFYGRPALLEAARALPDVRFRIMGGLGHDLAEAPKNVEFLGWISDPGAELVAATVLARLVEHDGMGATAIEGLLYARHVLYTRPLPHCQLIPFGDAGSLITELSRYLAMHEAGALQPNAEGFHWAREHYLPDVLARKMADALIAVSEREYLNG